MEENLVSDFSNYGKYFIGFLDWFASKHGLDGASLEGTKDRDRFTFILWMGLWHIVNRTLRCTVMTIRIRINIVGYTLENRNPTMTNWYTLAAYASTFNCHLISKIEISHPQTKGWDYLIYG